MVAMMPRIQVYYEHSDSWWQMPATKGYDIWVALNTTASHTFEYAWEVGKGKHRKTSHYLLDFDTVKQHNKETEKVREFQFIWTSPSPGEEHQLREFKPWLETCQASSREWFEELASTCFTNAIVILTAAIVILTAFAHGRQNM